MIKGLKWLLQFGLQQIYCCLFPAIIFLSLVVTKVWNLPWLFRYDWLLLICMVTQLLMLVGKLETIDEFKVIMAFHVIGLLLEIFKVAIGSWSYPEAGIFKIAGVPLYSGFMYASIGSYICKAWKVFKLRLKNWPSWYGVIFLCGSIYGNFFTHHFIWDLRWWLVGGVLLLFRATIIYFQVGVKEYSMPLIFSFFLIGFFIWIAENIASFFSAWAYPDQLLHWHLVHIGKISSWFLLIIISVVLVVQLKYWKKEG